jgi:DNA invertase Pin-like site-specific DNA recombinase
MRVALYARVSKPPKGELSDQAKRDQNPEVQLRELREWCQRNKHKIVVEYVDRLTGKNRKRPQLNKMLHDVTQGLQDVDAVVVWKLDRFGRSVQDLHNLVAELQQARVSFISQSEGFDLTTPIGKVLFSILAAFAEFERNVIAERTKAGLALARSEGRLPGRKIDPRKGPSRTTAWRQAKRAAA